LIINLVLSLESRKNRVLQSFVSEGSEMKKRIFWRVIGVAVVLGMISIGFGLKSSPLSSPSIISTAYADENFLNRPAKTPVYPNITFSLEVSHTIIYRGMKKSTLDEVESFLRTRLASETEPVDESRTALPSGLTEHPSITFSWAPKHVITYRGVSQPIIDEVEKLFRTITPSTNEPVIERTEIGPPPPEKTFAPKDEPTTDKAEDKADLNAKDPAEEFKEFIDKATSKAKASTPFDGKVSFDVVKAKETFGFYTATVIFTWKNGSTLIYTYIYADGEWRFKGAFGEWKEGKRTRHIPASDDALRPFFTP
jgi:hypothetical protein